MPLKSLVDKGVVAVLSTDAEGRLRATAAPVLRDLTLDVPPGEFLLVVGESGAGKSTLLRVLNGLVPHFYGGTISGWVRVAGHDPIAEGPGAMRSPPPT